MAEAAPLLFNPLDPAFRVDPYPCYARLRAEAPIYQTPVGSWVLSRYVDCAAALRDHARWSSDLRNNAVYQRALAEGRVDPSQEALGKTPPFLVLDPPDHTRLRGLVNKAFTPKVVEGLRPHVQQIVDELLDNVADKGSIEVIEDLAYPLPITVICEMLGVPPQDRQTFQQWSRELSRGLDPEEVLPPDAIERRRQAGNAFADYFRALIAERRRNPRDDLLSALIAAEEAGDKLTEDELVSTCIFLLAAGHETTVNLIGNGSLALLRHPDQLDLLRSDPSVARGAVEEILRYDPPVQYASRIAMEDIDLDGATIEKGRQAVILIGSANRDPDAFPEPDRFDITRGDSRHLAFGLGIHFCLGAPLARVEGEIAFATLVRRLDGLHLLAEAPEYKEHIVNRGLRSLPVSFSTAS
jgi:cytochrome P450